MNHRQSGFTIIEILFVIVILASASIIFFVQKNNLETAARDTQRKTAINAMHYGLEEVFFKANGYYPRTINEEVLPSVDPDLFDDPSGIALGEADSNYRYEALDCSDDQCRGYELRTTLENEDDYIKTNR